MCPPLVAPLYIIADIIENVYYLKEFCQLSMIEIFSMIIETLLTSVSVLICIPQVEDFLYFLWMEQFIKNLL